MKLISQISSPTPEANILSSQQRACYEASLSNQSVAAEADAGTGKTFTAIAISLNYDGRVEHVPFSRSLADEMIERFRGVSHCNVLNFHRRGIKLLGNVDTDKQKNKKLAEIDYGKDASKIAELVEKLKVEAYGLDTCKLTALEIAHKYSFNTDDEKLDIVQAAIEVLALSDKQTSVIDFDDMLRFPVLLGKKEVLNALIVLDEVQDYTPNSWAFLKNCITTKDSHVFMIGDRKQTLMAFAGASSAIYQDMVDHYGCESLAINENRRCAKAIVAAAPHKGNMVALPDAPEGEVTTMSKASVMNDIADGLYANDALLSETNAPLITMGIDLITKGIPVRMRTEKFMSLIFRYAYKYLDTRKTKVGEMTEKLQKDLTIASQEGGDVAEFSDVVNCITALETYCVSKGMTKPAWKFRKPIHPIQQALEILAGGDTGITLMTGHTSKGLEWNTVFHLPAQMKEPEQEWQVEQNNCLAHVIATRAITKFVTLVD